MKSGLPRELLDRAVEPYRPAGRLAWHFARGKLKHDPVFHQVLQQGLVPPGASVLDIGCGQGLLTSLVLAAAELADQGKLPAQWPAAGMPSSFRGIDLRRRDIERARIALGNDAEFAVGDMRTADFGRVDVVVVLDVLHYVDYQAQEDVLNRIHAALRPGGRLILRVGDAGRTTRARISRLIDSLVLACRRQWLVTQHCRSRADWIGLLQQSGFKVQILADHEYGPFSTILMVDDPAVK